MAFGANILGASYAMECSKRLVNGRNISAFYYVVPKQIILPNLTLIELTRQTL